MTDAWKRRGGRLALALVAACIAVGAETSAASGARPCDGDAIRARVQPDFPGYRVAEVRAEQGIVTLLLRAPDGAASLAVALYASGTRLATSVTSVGLDADEVARASRPITTWWQIADLQRALAACSESLPEGKLGDLDSTLHAAAEARLGHQPGLGLALATRFGAVLSVVLAAGVLVGLWRSRRRLVDRDTWIVVGLTALALLLRFVAHAGPSDVREVIEEPATRRAGWTALLDLIFSVLPRQDETVWTINRIVGAASVSLLYVVMRRRFGDRVAALAGAATLAVTPLIVRFSASDTPYIVLCAALLGAVTAYDRYVESGATSALALGLGLLTVALQLRPEGAWLCVPAGLIAVSGGVPRHRDAWMQRAVAALCVLLFVVINVVGLRWTLAGAGHAPEGFVLIGSAFGSPWADPNATPRMLCALLVLGAASALVYRWRSVGVLWLAAVLVALPLYFPVLVAAAVRIDGVPTGAYAEQYNNARYHLPAMYLGCGLVGLGVATVLDIVGRLIGRVLPAAGVIAVAIVCLAAAPRRDLLWRMWTPQREFEFFRDTVARVSSECDVVALFRGVDAGFVPFGYLRPNMIDADDFLAAAPPGECFVYYRSGNCYAPELVPPEDRPDFEMNPTCRAIEERFRLEPIAETRLPAVPYRGEVYSRDPLPVGFYRLRDKQPDSR